MSDTFRVALTRDILDSRGEPAFGRTALSILDRAPAAGAPVTAAPRPDGVPAPRKTPAPAPPPQEPPKPSKPVDPFL